jgi:hypothetical protein
MTACRFAASLGTVKLPRFGREPCNLEASNLCLRGVDRIERFSARAIVMNRITTNTLLR